MGLHAVRGREHKVVSGLDQGHRRYDGFVEIVASRACAAALDLDASRVGSEYQHGAFAHRTSPSLIRSFRAKCTFGRIPPSARPSHVVVTPVWTSARGAP